MTITTVKYDNDKIKLPGEIINLEGIEQGDYIEIEVKKIIKKKKNLKKRKIIKKKFTVIMPCPSCGSLYTVGYGSRMTKIGKKQIRQCRKCGKHYTVQDESNTKMKNSKEVIKEALRLSENHSLRDTARQIKEKFNVQISYSAIGIWRKKFKNLILDNESKEHF